MKGEMPQYTDAILEFILRKRMMMRNAHTIKNITVLSPNLSMVSMNTSRNGFIPFLRIGENKRSKGFFKYYKKK